MKALIFIFSIVIVFAFAATIANATTPAWMAQDTIKVLNKRLSFSSSPVRAQSARCQRNGDGFFCIVTLRQPYKSYGPLSYIVSQSNGYWNWSLQK